MKLPNDPVDNSKAVDGEVELTPVDLEDSFGYLDRLDWHVLQIRRDGEPEL